MPRKRRGGKKMLKKGGASRKMGAIKTTFGNRVMTGGKR